MTVTEISEQGNVPEIVVVNSAPQPVLILDGEELLGAKQNRIVNLTIMVPPRTTLRIPVSCVEARRWHAESRVFRSSPYLQYPSARAAKLRAVSCEMRVSGRRRSDQAAIWADIEPKASRLGVRSPTSAMRDLYDRHLPRLEDYAGAQTFTANQRGAIFAVDGKVRGLELFNHPATLRRLLPKLIRSYALDALDSFQPRAAALRLAAAAAFLRLLVRIRVHEEPALGFGTDLRLESRTVVAGALVALGGLVHLCAFRFSKAAWGGGFIHWRSRYH
ncbi:MAG: hypothetical protein NZ554_07480 [Bryobacteraceae bacterium]|nr:hypothetical protein [Bryobacteraceae bacterium]